MNRKNVQISLWFMLFIFVGLSCYFITVNVYRDVIPSRNQTLINSEIIAILHNKSTITEDDKNKIKTIVDERGFYIRSLGIEKDVDPSQGILDQLKDLLLVYPEAFDVNRIGISAGTYKGWTIYTEKKKEFEDDELKKGYSAGLYFLEIAILLHAIIIILTYKRWKNKWIGLIVYAPPQLIALCVLFFTSIRISSI